MTIGNAIVGQSGGCTAVINQSLAGVIEAARKSRKIKKLWGMRHGIRGVLNNDLIDLSKKSPSLINEIKNLPSAALGSARYRLKPGDEKRILKRLKALKVRYFFLIGGNDTAETLHRISITTKQIGYDLKVIHIPKTIDNDLIGTDHCPGFGSVARFAAIATQEAGLDTKAMRHVDPVKIIEFMGRNSGWITASSALLKKSKQDPPHILIIPEMAFSEKEFVRNVKKCLKTVGFCVIAISETIRDQKGRKVGARLEGILKDSFGHRYVEGAAHQLAKIIEKKLKVRARFDKPGTIQRMSIPYISSVDQREAFQAGFQAVKWALGGLTDVMVAFKRKSGRKYGITYEPVLLEKIPHEERYMPAHFLTRNKTMISPAFSKYALPLIGGKLPKFSSLS